MLKKNCGTSTKQIFAMVLKTNLCQGCFPSVPDKIKLSIIVGSLNESHTDYVVFLYREVELLMGDIIKLTKGLTRRYLLPCNEGYLLVEGGSESEFSLFLEELKEQDIDPVEIKYLFLSHHHEDHAGFASSLRELSDCRIIAHKEALETLEAGEHFIPGEGGIVNRRVILYGYYLFLTKKVRLELNPLKIKEDDLPVTGDNNELLRTLGVPGKILATPGHSPDSISLLLDEGSCFCGDLAMSEPAWLGTRKCCIFISDIEKYYTSWQKIIDEGARTIYPAHGQPFSYRELEKNMQAFSEEDLIKKRPGQGKLRRPESTNKAVN